MTEYSVLWAVEVEADSPLAAAQLAQSMQRDPDSTAQQFFVSGRPHGTWSIDLGQQPATRLKLNADLDDIDPTLDDEHPVEGDA